MIGSPLMSCQNTGLKHGATNIALEAHEVWDRNLRPQQRGPQVRVRRRPGVFTCGTERAAGRVVGAGTRVLAEAKSCAIEGRESRPTYDQAERLRLVLG